MACIGPVGRCVHAGTVAPIFTPAAAVYIAVIFCIYTNSVFYTVIKMAFVYVFIYKGEGTFTMVDAMAKMAKKKVSFRRY